MDLVMAPREREVWWFVGRTGAGNLLWSRLTECNGYEYYEIPVAEFWPAPKPVEPQQTARVGTIFDGLIAMLGRMFSPADLKSDYALAGGKEAE